MKFATGTQIIVLTAVSCLALFVLDYVKNPQLWHHAHPEGESAGAGNGARLTLWFNSPCSAECREELHQALLTVGGIDGAAAVASQPVLASAPVTRPGTSLPEHVNQVGLPVTDLDKLDFAALDRALRAKGLVAGRMELGGIEHFRLEATLNYLPGGSGQDSIQEQLEFVKARAQGAQFAWLDSLGVDKDRKIVTAYARFVQPGHTVDVSDLLAGLNLLGYAPLSLHARVGEHMNLVSHAGH